MNPPSSLQSKQPSHAASTPRKGYSCAHCARPSRDLIALLPDRKRICPACFTVIIEKRLRAGVRLLNLADAPVIEYLNDSSAPGAATAYILESLFRKTPKKIIECRPLQVRKRSSGHEHTPPDLLLPISLEEVTAQGISFFLEKKKQLHLPHSVTALCSMDELERFCALKHLPFTSRLPASNPLLDNLQNVSPQTQHATLSSLQQLAERLSGNRGQK